MAEKRDESFTVKMSRAERDAADADARRFGVSRSELVRRSLKRYRSDRLSEERQRASKKPASE